MYSMYSATYVLSQYGGVNKHVVPATAIALLFIVYPQEIQENVSNGLKRQRLVNKLVYCTELYSPMVQKKLIALLS